ncbi:hypothetical protein POM88_053907 [Heracleum sosnowskyi]|uniref:FAR1 domain-containing protein n=1 Tax=Heracleum sosnowskyi TaxID=360622 RepID=A0AAD8LX72_9APIA|nr:hypothetical protein POM88_053907 [Heracleum sosnowskyi]
MCYLRDSLTGESCVSDQFSICGDSSCISSEVVHDVSISVSSTESDGSVTSSRLSPGGHRYFILTVDAACVPFPGQVFDTLHKSFKFYEAYDQICGFDIRRTAEKNDESETVVLKHFVCNREGFNDVRFRSSNGSRSKVVKPTRTMSRRCGCRARIVVMITSEKTYFVFLAFLKEHNHPLVPESGRQFLKVNKEMNVGLRNIVFHASKVNIGRSKAFYLAKEMYGGYANVGATLRDFRNFDRDLKADVGERDGQMIIEKFKVMDESCESFYYAFEVNPAGHLTKLFWADAVGRRNFELYGDAVSFDATFDTNK